jgi:putative flavoprotein involved in K+ transport
VGQAAKQEAAMLARSESLVAVVEHWLAQFERALSERDDVLMKILFHSDSHWRDVLALTWHIRTVNGIDAVSNALEAHCGRACPAGFSVALDRTAPRYVTRAGTDAIEAIFRFETAEGRGIGVLRLTPDASDRNVLKSMDAAHGARRNKGIGACRKITICWQRLFDRFSWP